MLIRSGILRERRLLQLGGKFRAALNKFHGALLGRWEEHIKLLDVRVQTKFFELCEDPVRVLLVVRRTNMVRMRSEPLHVCAQILRTRNGAQLLFPLPFGLRRLRRITIQRLLLGDNVMAGRRKR